MVTKKPNKSAPINWKFFCKMCDYYTYDKRDFARHKSTRKHLKREIMQNIAIKPDELLKNVCLICGKKYKHRSGLSRHRKQCVLIKQIDIEKNVENPEKTGKMMVTKKTEGILKKRTKVSKKNDEKFWELEAERNLKEKLEMKTKLLETQIQHKNEIIKMKDDVINIVKNSHYTTNNFNNCNNKNLTVNLFLNENCKNAMNLTDFVDQIKVQLEDVLYQQKYGSTEGLTNILTKQLQDINPVDRPIHCSDEKNLQFYIKEDDKWSKNKTDDDMEKSLRKIQVKQILVMKEWEDKYPNFEESDELLEERNKLMAQILHGCDDKIAMRKNVKDVKKNVAKLLSIQEVMDNMDK